MKRIFTEISAFAFIVAVLFSAGCLSDDLGRSDNGSGTGSTEPTIPDNSVIDAGMFSALNLDYPGLAARESLLRFRPVLSGGAGFAGVLPRTDRCDQRQCQSDCTLDLRTGAGVGRLRPCQERIPFLQRHVHGRRQTLFLPDVQQNRLGETCFGRSGRALQSASPSVDGSAGQGLPYVA